MTDSNFATRWSQIDQLHAGGADRVWEWFVARYHDYVAGALRGSGFRPAEVEDLIDEFWGYLFQSSATARADRSGRFRSFLAGVVRNFARNWARDRRRLVSAGNPDSLSAPTEVSREDDHSLWGQQILSLALERLAQQHPIDARCLRRFYGIGESSREPAAAIARDLQRTPNAIHQLLFKARRRLLECVRQEVDMTVSNGDEFTEEVALVVAALERRLPGLTG